jgi:radical SAM superfamily enzyme YgiQ (UPF0313 family)
MTSNTVATLLTPPCDGHDRIDDLGLALSSLKASLERSGVSTSAFRVTPDDGTIPASPMTRFVGLSVLFTAQVPVAFRLANAVRATDPNVHISIGGQGTSFVWERILQECPAIDSAACFEADETIIDLVRSVLETRPLSDVLGIYYRTSQGEFRFTGYRDPPTDLDRLPFPTRTEGDFVLGQPHLSLLSSRGCSAHCTFCQSGNYGNRYHDQPKWRPRGVNSIISEILELSQTYGANTFSFVDDDFLGACPDGPPRARAFAAALLDMAPEHQFSWSIECRVDEIDPELFAMMRDAGLKHVFMGVESGNEQDLRLFGKRTHLVQATNAIEALRSLGIEVTIGFIMFQPFSSRTELEDNIRFLRDNRVASVARMTNYLQLYPGSPLVRPFGARGVSLSEVGYEVTYEYVDPDVGRYRTALVAALAGFRDIEAKLSRGLFKLETGIDVPVDGVEHRRLLETGAQLTGRLSDTEADLALRLLVDDDRAAAAQGAAALQAEASHAVTEWAQQFETT